MVQLRRTALEQNLHVATERLRCGTDGKLREHIQQSATWILVGVDGSLTIEARPGGPLGLERPPNGFYAPIVQ